MSKYLLDANVFIAAHKQYYGFEFCPAFWEWLETKDATILSNEPVLMEINSFEDELKRWANSKGRRNRSSHK